MFFQALGLLYLHLFSVIVASLVDYRIRSDCGNGLCTEHWDFKAEALKVHCSFRLRILSLSLSVFLPCVSYLIFEVKICGALCRLHAGAHSAVLTQ